MPIQAGEYFTENVVETYGKINIRNHYNLYNFSVNRQLIVMGDFSRSTTRRTEHSLDCPMPSMVRRGETPKRDF